MFGLWEKTGTLKEEWRIIYFEVEIVGLGLHFCDDFTSAGFQCKREWKINPSDEA